MNNNNDKKSLERKYLEDIHDSLDEDSLLDLHTYFWAKEFLNCPICLLRLYMTKEEMMNEQH